MDRLTPFIGSACSLELSPAFVRFVGCLLVGAMIVWLGVNAVSDKLGVQSTLMIWA